MNLVNGEERRGNEPEGDRSLGRTERSLDAFVSRCERVWRRVLEEAPAEVQTCARETGLHLLVADSAPAPVLEELELGSPERLPVLCIEGGHRGFQDLALSPLGYRPGSDAILLFRVGLAVLEEKSLGAGDWSPDFVVGDPSRDPTRPWELDGLAALLIHEITTHFGFGDEMREDWERGILEGGEV